MPLFPAALPPLVGVISFLFLYSESGVVTRAIQHIFGMDEAPWRLQGVSAIIFVHAYTMYVYVFLFVSAGLERFDTTLDEAASGLGANSWHRLRVVTLPLLTPALAGSMLLVFMTSLGSFSAPYVFGGGIRVLVDADRRIEAQRIARTRLCRDDCPCIERGCRPALFRWLERKRKYTSSGKGSATRRVIKSRRAQVVAAVLATITVIVLVLPHLMIMLVSFAVDGAWTTQVMPPEYTLDNYRRLFSEAELWRPMVNSLSMAVIATAANLIVCFVAAYLIVLRKFSGRRTLEVLVALPWAIPATAIALGLAATFNRNDLFSARILLVGTFWILPLAYFVRGIPLVSTAVEGSLRQLDPALEDAASGLGASWWLTMRKVVLPAARPGLVAGGLLAAVTAVGEFVAGVVLYTHSNRPISMEILAQLRQLAFGTASAYSVLLILLVLLMTMTARSFEERMA